MTPQMLEWKEAFPAGPGRCGGKGHNLARLARYGFPVPAGGVLTAEAYAELMSAPDLAGRASALAGVGADETLDAPVAAKLEALRAAIEHARLSASLRAELARFLDERGLADKPVAVRSSAIAEDGASASFAGIHRSFLNARGLHAVEDAILGCFASLWTPQAVSYRRRMKLADHDLSCAVVICALVTRRGAGEPASAGVAFSCDPRTGRRDLIVINAAHGMGEKVVSGAVDPDQIEIQNLRGTLRTIHRRLRGDPVLTPAQETELARQVWRIHWALGGGDAPQDVEWAHDGERFWIVQARAVTRVPLRTFDRVKHLPVIWSTANIKEAVPGVVTLLSWNMIREEIDHLLYAAPLKLGFEVPSAMQTVRRFKGRAYFDLTAIQWCLYDFVGLTPAEAARSLGGHQPAIPVPEGSRYVGKVGRRRRWNALRLLTQFWRLPEALTRGSRLHFSEVRRLAQLNFACLSDEQLLGVFRQMEALQERIDPLVGLANACPGPFQLALEKQLRILAGERAHSLMNRLLTGGGGITSAEQGYRINDLAEVARQDPDARAWLGSNLPAQSWTNLPRTSAFRRALEGYLYDFGHRAVYEADAINPRWVEDPSYILDAVRGYLKAGSFGRPREAAGKVRALAQAELKTLTSWRRPVIRWLAKRLQRALALREYAKSTMAAGMWAGRLAALEVGRRLTAAGCLDAPSQVFHLSRADLLLILRGEWDGRGARELARDRETQREQWLSEPAPPDVIIEGGDMPGTDESPVAEPSFDGECWLGIGVAPGRAIGPARVLRHPEEGAGLARGEVLAAPSTDPGWTPLFLRACGIVMEIGGYLSHGAIVAREYGIPAVVNIPGLLDHLHDGEHLVVDGDAGRVALLDPERDGRSAQREEGRQTVIRRGSALPGIPAAWSCSDRDEDFTSNADGDVLKG